MSAEAATRRFHARADSRKVAIDTHQTEQALIITYLPSASTQKDDLKSKMYISTNRRIRVKNLESPRISLIAKDIIAGCSLIDKSFQKEVEFLLEKLQARDDLNKKTLERALTPNRRLVNPNFYDDEGVDLIPRHVIHA